MLLYFSSRLFLLFLALGFFVNAYSQVDIQWQRISSDVHGNRAIHMVKMVDGSLVTVGHEFNAIGGTVPNDCSMGLTRGIVVKYKPDGTQLWKRCLGIDPFSRVVYALETANKGILVVGYGSGDYLDQIRIYRLDSSANILWMRHFGGTGQDRAYSATKTSDGGFVIVGETNANDGDLAGTGYHGPTGIIDRLVFKLDSAGAVVWKKCYGGTGMEDIEEMEINGTQVLELPDGNLMVAGRTASNNGDVSGNHGGADAWLMKLSPTGILLWQKCFGSTGNEKFMSIELDIDGFVLIGNTNSNSGMVVGNHGMNDVWLVKTDFNGNLIWQKCIGGSANELGSNVKRVADGYVITGVSRSSDGDFQQHLGLDDGFVGKVDFSGNLVWLKNYGGSEREFFQNIIPIWVSSRWWWWVVVVVSSPKSSTV